MDTITKDELFNIIINNCPNYDQILNYVETDDEVVTDCLVDFYRNSIYKIDPHNKAHIRFISELDNIMNMYINDSNLVDIIKDIMISDNNFCKSNQITDSLFMKIRKTVKEYSDTKFKKVENPIWI